MNNQIKRLIEQVVEKMALESAEAGLELNQNMRANKFTEVKNKIIAGELSEQDLKNYLAEPDLKMLPPKVTSFRR